MTELDPNTDRSTEVYRPGASVNCSTSVRPGTPGLTALLASVLMKNLLPPPPNNASSAAEKEEVSNADGQQQAQQLAPTLGSVSRI